MLSLCRAFIDVWPMTDSDCAHLLCLVNPGDPFDLSLERPIGWPVQFGEALSGVVGPV